MAKSCEYIDKTLGWLQRWLPSLKVLYIIVLGLFVILIAVNFENIASYLSPGKQDNARLEVAKFIAYLIGGGLLFWQILILNRRTIAIEKQADITSKALENAAKGQRDERFKNAIDQLGSPTTAVRLGAIYTLHQLAKDGEEYRETVFNILCSYIRETTNQEEYRKREDTSIEIQSILDLMFRNEKERSNYNGFKADLRDSNLLKADLSNSFLKYANLTRANLTKASLNSAFMNEAILTTAVLFKANLKNAYLQRASLWGTILIGANLESANMQGAWLGLAKMQGTYSRLIKLQDANLMATYLEGAFLYGAQLQGAYLSSAQLQGADLRYAQMQAAYLPGAQFQSATVDFACLHGASCDKEKGNFMGRLQSQIGYESELSKINSGVLTEEDVNNILRTVEISDEKFSQDLAIRLRSRIGQNVNLSNADLGLLTPDIVDEIIENVKKEAPFLLNVGN